MVIYHDNKNKVDGNLLDKVKIVYMWASVVLALWNNGKKFCTHSNMENHQ